MHIPDRIIEIGGADRPVVPVRLKEYVGIDPQYRRFVCRSRTQAALAEWGVHSTLIEEPVEAVSPDSVRPADLVVMRNVLGNMIEGHVRTVRRALGFVSQTGVLVIIEDISAAQARLPEVEAAMETEGHWSALYGAAQTSFRHMNEDLGLAEPKLSHRMLRVTPVADPLQALRGESA